MPPLTDSRRSKATLSRSRTTELRRPRPGLAVALSLMLLALGACGGDDLLLPSSGEPSRIEAVSGNSQTGTVGQTLDVPLVVEVTDPANRPVPEVEVVFIAPAGAELVPNDTVFTGPDGRATVTYTLATVSGQQTIEARAKPVVPSVSLTTTFSQIAEPETASQLVMAAGDGQTGELQTALGDSLAVKAVDRFGNGVAGIEVTWDAEVGAVSPATMVTGSDGRAATQRTLGGRPGSYRTEASAPDLEGSPVAFTATGIAPPSPQLIVVTQPSATASAGVPLTRQPVLQLQDAAGAPLVRADVVVTVQIASGDGSLGGSTTARSDADGRVSFEDLSIRGRPGSRSLLFAAVDFTPATSDEIAVRAGPPAANRTSTSVGNGTAGVATTIAVHLEDEFGTDVEDAAGMIRVRVEGANPADVPVSDQGGGTYSASYRPSVTGTDQISVEVNGAQVPDGPFRSIVSPGPAAASATTAQVSRSGAFFVEITILVTTRDAEGNLRGRGGERVQVQLEGSDVLRDAHDNGDGTYSDQFVVVLSNPRVIILLNGQPISGSPYGP